MLNFICEIFFIFCYRFQFTYVSTTFVEVLMDLINFSDEFIRVFSACLVSLYFSVVRKR